MQVTMRRYISSPKHEHKWGGVAISESRGQVAKVTSARMRSARSWKLATSVEKGVMNEQMRGRSTDKRGKETLCISRGCKRNGQVKHKDCGELACIHTRRPRRVRGERTVGSVVCFFNAPAHKPADFLLVCGKVCPDFLRRINVRRAVAVGLVG
jgi:hypothetical protein